MEHNKAFACSAECTVHAWTKGEKSQEKPKMGGGGNDVMYCKQESNLGVNMCKATGHVMMLQTQEDCLYSLWLVQPMKFLSKYAILNKWAVF